MQPNFQIEALSEASFAPLFDHDEARLAMLGIRRETVAAKPGTPCRVSLADAGVGEEVLLLPYEHHAADSPYRASGPIYVRRGVAQRRFAPGAVPEMLAHRHLSLRAYDDAGMMRAAETCSGDVLAERLAALCNQPSTAYVDVHNAGQGCFNCRARKVLP